jgi:3-oxoacyl-[acyl-carrier-protein] synthase-3/clorobiocin biosynthesis protein CloN2
VRTDGIHLGGLGVHIPETVTVRWAVEQGLYPAAAAEEQGLLATAVAGDTPAPEMALHAAQEALKQHGAPLEELGLLLYADVWHQGPDGWSPHYYLQHHLVGGDLLALEVRQGCNGVFAALELAAPYLGDGRDALIVAADNFGTARIDRWRAGPNFILGDGAAAVVLTRRPGFARLLSVNSVTIPEAEELHRQGEPLFPPGATTGDVVDFAARSEEFVRLTLSKLDLAMIWITMHDKFVQVMKKTLDEAGIAAEQVARVAFTNLGRQAVEERCVGALGLPMEKSTWEHGRTVGHLGASDQLVALRQLLAAGELRPGDHLLMASLGPGVTASCAVVRIGA